MVVKSLEEGWPTRQKPKQENEPTAPKDITNDKEKEAGYPNLAVDTEIVDVESSV